MRIKSAAAVSLAVAMSMAACAQSGDSAGDEGPVKVALLAEISGPFGPLGQLVVGGQQIAYDRANADGGVCGRQIEPVVKDIGYTAQQALSVFSSIKTDKAFVGVSSLQGSQGTNALIPELKKLDMSAIPSTWGASALASPNIFMVGATYERQAINGIDWMIEQGKVTEGDTVGVIYLAGAYGGAMLNGVKYAAEQNGLKVVDASVQPTDTDMSANVTNLKDKGAKLVVVAGIPDQTSSAVSVASSRGFDVPVLVTTAGFSPGLLKTSAKDALEKQLYLVGGWRGADASDNKAIAALAPELAKIDPKLSVDRNVVAGYGDAAALVDVMRAACKDGDLTAASVTKAISETKSLDTQGIFPPQSYEDRSVSPSDASFIFQAASDVPGGLKQVSKEYTGKDQATYKDDLTPIS